MFTIFVISNVKPLSEYLHAIHVNIKTFKMMFMMTEKAETHSLVWNVIVTGSSRGKVYSWPLPGNNHKIIFKFT